VRRAAPPSLERGNFAPCHPSQEGSRVASLGDPCYHEQVTLGKGIMTTLERTLAIAVLAVIWLLLPV
jgi:hypothetical protein